MHEAPVFLPSGQKVGPYVIERVLGHGANGIAYLAHDKTLDRKVVLKEHYPQELCTRDAASHCLISLDEGTEHIFAESVNQFIREARLIASLEHPSIIKIHRVFSLSPTTCFYVMPLLEGGTLRDVIHSGKRIPPSSIISWLQVLVSALDCLNRHHIIHLDIKPGNILFTKEGQPVLADFGTASQRPLHGMVNVLAHSAYSAPELFTENAVPDIRADQYSLAACFYELISGKKPLSAIERVEEDTLVPLANLKKNKGLSPLFLHSIDKNLSFSPEDRFRDADVWKSVLEVESTIPTARRTWKIISLCLGVLLAGCILGGGLWINNIQKIMPAGETERPVDIDQLYLDIAKENQVEDIKAAIALMGQDREKAVEEHLNQWKLEFDQQLIKFEKSPFEEERRSILKKTRALQAALPDEVSVVSEVSDSGYRTISFLLNLLWQKTRCMNSSHPVLKSRPELIPLIETKLGDDLSSSRIQGDSIMGFIGWNNREEIDEYSNNIISKMEDKLNEESS